MTESGSVKYWIECPYGHAWNPEPGSDLEQKCKEEHPFSHEVEAIDCSECGYEDQALYEHQLGLF